MKTGIKIKEHFCNFLILTLILTTSSNLFAQEKISHPKDFKVLVETTDSGIKIKCLEGCAWDELMYSINDYQPQAIDEFGITELVKNSSIKDPNLADFLISVIKTKNRLILKGIEGTVWTDLSFTIPKTGNQAFNQFGMTKLN